MREKYRGFACGDIINGGVYHGKEIHRIYWITKKISINLGGGCLRVLRFREFDEQVVGIF
jgi:hypothetical protein